MGRKRKGFQAKVALIRAVKHLLDCVDDYRFFYDLATGDHPEWKEDLDKIGMGLALIYEAMETIYRACWGEPPEGWITHH